MQSNIHDQAAAKLAAAYRAFIDPVSNCNLESSIEDKLRSSGKDFANNYCFDFTVIESEKMFGDNYSTMQVICKKCRLQYPVNGVILQGLLTGFETMFYCDQNNKETSHTLISVYTEKMTNLTTRSIEWVMRKYMQIILLMDLLYMYLLHKKGLQNYEPRRFCAMPGTRYYSELDLVIAFNHGISFAEEELITKKANLILIEPEQPIAFKEFEKLNTRKINTMQALDMLLRTCCEFEATKELFRFIKIPQKKKSAFLFTNSESAFKQHSKILKSDSVINTLLSKM